MHSEKHSNTVSISNREILIVDDNTVLRSLISEYLENLGAQVTQAENGQIALKIVTQKQFDVIISDIKMPVMTGVTFMQNIPALNKDSVKIIMSGEASIEDVILSFKEQIDEFIMKPFPSMEIIRQAIERQLLKHHLRTDLLFKNRIVKHYNEILQFLVSNSDLKKTFQFVYHSIQKLIPIGQMELLIFDLSQEILTKKYMINDKKLDCLAHNSTKPKLLNLIKDMDDNLSNAMIKKFCKENSELFFKDALHNKMKSSITFPLVVKKRIYGFISFFSNQTSSISKQNEYILKGIVPEISVSVERAIYQGQLYEENYLLRSTTQELNNQLLAQQDALIFSLAELAEKRDNETGKHLLRIQAFTKTIAEALFKDVDSFDIGYGEIDIKQIIEIIEKSSTLHDIGKVGIPDSILLKPEKLNNKEFKTLQQHTLIGAKCLKNASDKVYNNNFLKVSMDIAYSHHEKWNGKGYPDGKKGEEIPLPARIVAIADVFDALRSPRCYKHSWRFQTVCNHIEKEKGKHFDPEIVDAFITVKDKIEEIYTQLKD